MSYNVQYFSSLYIKNTTFSNNIGEGWGSAIHAFRAYASIKTSRFISNKAERNDVVLFVDSLGVIESSEFYGNIVDSIYGKFVIRCANNGGGGKVKFSNNNIEKDLIMNANNSCEIIDEINY